MRKKLLSNCDRVYFIVSVSYDNCNNIVRVSQWRLNVEREHIRYDFEKTRAFEEGPRSDPSVYEICDFGSDVLQHMPGASFSS